MKTIWECEAIFVKIWECKTNLWKQLENVKQNLWKFANFIRENNLQCEKKSLNIWECKINFWKQLASVNKIYKHFRNSNKIMKTIGEYETKSMKTRDFFKNYDMKKIQN